MGQAIQVWDQVFHNLDLSYSESPNSQGKLFEIVKVKFLSKIFPPPPATMLEVGCGTAFVSLYFAKRGYTVTCSDLNPHILKTAADNFRSQKVTGKFVVADAKKLPFKPHSFDIVTSFGLLEHFPDPAPIIAEMARVTKPGGLFFADIVPNRFSVQSLGNIFNFLVTLPFSWAKAIRNFRPLYFENSFSPDQYIQMMRAASLKNIQVQGNRPFPRLTLPPILDRLYASVLRLTLPLWRLFDQIDNPFSRLWGAGLWFWGTKN